MRSQAKFLDGTFVESCANCEYWSGSRFFKNKCALCMHPLMVEAREKGFRTMSRGPESWCNGFVPWKGER